MDPLKKLKRMRAKVRKIEDTAAFYKKLYEADGYISAEEQKAMNRLDASIKEALELMAKEEAKLSSEQVLENYYTAGKEAVADAMSTEDDIISDAAIDDLPLSTLQGGNLKGIKAVVHSAFWTEKLLEWVIARSNLTVEELIIEVLRINNKDYKDKSSIDHAVKNYECKGSVVSITKGEGDFMLEGFTNAKDGPVMRFTIHMIGSGLIEVEQITYIEDAPKGKGIQQLGGVSGGAATFVMKYSGFGKLSRALSNYMEGKDPWTGEEGATLELAIGGITDLLTMGWGASAKGIVGIRSFIELPAVTNIIVNILQEIAENIGSEQLEEIGLTREALDILLSLNGENKYIKAVELLSNAIQAGLVSRDVVYKHLKKSINEDDLIVSPK